MRPKFVAALAVLPLALPLMLGSGAAAATPPAARYAALGDSYASGVAAGSYDPASGSCHRSARAYPALWAAEHHPAAFLAAACSGATTQSVLRDQLPEVPADTTLVTLTVGGNNLDFAGAAGSCLQPFTTDGRCDRALDESERRLRDDLPEQLDRTYQAISSAAPAARVVVTGYPHLLATGTTCWVGTDARRARFNALTDRLDELISRQAAKRGFEFADVRTAFAGHEVCAPGGEEWITRIVLTSLFESFHPTPAGQAEGFLPTVSPAAAG